MKRGETVPYGPLGAVEDFPFPPLTAEPREDVERDDVDTGILRGGQTSTGLPADHSHDGSGADSTVVGTDATATGSGATAGGDGADAVNDNDTAYGQNSLATGGAATVTGADATANAGSAVFGQAASSGENGTAVGASANATGHASIPNVAVGRAATAGSGGAGGATSVGFDADAHAGNSSAVGRSSSVASSHTNSFAAGANVATDKANQHKIGASVLTARGFEGAVRRRTFPQGTPYTADEADLFITVDASGGAITINLPASTSLNQGAMYWIKKIDSSGNAVTVAADTSGTADLIDGAATVTLAAQYDALIVVATDVDKWSIFQFGSP